jgi:hypothetical protein
MKLITETIEEVRVLTETSEHEPKQYFIEDISIDDSRKRNDEIRRAVH